MHCGIWDACREGVRHPRLVLMMTKVSTLDGDPRESGCQKATRIPSEWDVIDPSGSTGAVVY